MTTLIRPVADAAAGAATNIAAAAFDDTEVLAALRNGSGNLELIGWQASSTDFTRGPEGDAGAVSEVTLALLGRRAVTAVCSGSGKLLLISWDVPAGLTSITRLHDTGSVAGAATNIALVALDDTLLVTALRAGNGNLFLICWRLEADGTISRLGDAEAGRLDALAPIVTLAAIDGGNVVTAICNESGNLELIGWSVSSGGNIERWGVGESGATAGTVTDIALMPIAAGGAASDVVTAVRDGSQNLLVIAWRPDPSSGAFTRLSDSGGEAGAATAIALTTGLSPTTTPTIFVSVRRGSGNLGIIAFELISEGGNAAVITRTGDFADSGSRNVSETHLAALDSGRLLSVVSADGNLRLVEYAVSAVVTTFIRPVATGAAGHVSELLTGAFSESELVTAVINGSGDLELIGWQTPPATFTVTRGASITAAAANEVALTLMGRTAVTVTSDGDGNLLLSSWNIPLGLTTIAHLADARAGAATDIAVAALGATLFVTALRAGNGQLLLIAWKLDADGSFARLGEARAGEVRFVTIAAIDGGNVVTAVRNGSDDLELIGWSVSPGGDITRWGQSGGQAGNVSEIAILAIAGSGPTSDIVTAVCDGSGNLLLILWRPTPASGTIRRLSDTGSEAGTATAIAITATVTSGGTPTILAAMRRGSGNLEIIAFVSITDGGGEPVIVRTGAYTNRGDAQVSVTSLSTLQAGRIASALDVNGSLLVTTYNVLDAATTPAPATILQIRYQNPNLSITSNPGWASSATGTFPTTSDVPFEWTQVLAPADDYDDNVVGCAGWVIAPDDSDADLPFSHPFGFDWEFSVALDDDDNRYTRLLSPGSGVDHEGDPGQDVFPLAASLGLSPSGMLGLEWESGLVPRSFRAQVEHGDRVAAFGRWIVDTGHDFGGSYRTEIHPPLLLATASVPQEAGALPFTRALFTSRPYLTAQRYTRHLDDVYYDASGDDGPFFDHIVKELARASLFGERAAAHPKITSFPFRGKHEFTIHVRPPPVPPGSAHRLVVSFQFTVRTGCTVAITQSSEDTVDVTVNLDDAAYVPPPLPYRSEVTYRRERLGQLNAELGYSIYDIGALVLALLALGAVGLGLAAYIEYVLSRGVVTDEYASLTEVDVRNSDNAVLNVLANAIPAGAGIVADNDQPHPIYGWLEAKWESAVAGKPALTTKNVNAWLKTVLAEPARARELKKDWKQFLLSEFDVTKEQAESISLVPPEHARELQRAIARVLDGGGSIRLERRTEIAPGRLAVEPAASSRTVSTDLSIGVFHCTFDANCRNWHCGWGPART